MMKYVQVQLELLSHVVGDHLSSAYHLSSVQNTCIIPLNPGWFIEIPRSWIIVIPNQSPRYWVDLGSIIP